MKKAIWWIIAIVVVVIIIVSMSGNKAAQEAGPIILGASMPMTGEAASYGEGGKAGIDLAVKEINEKGGINGRMLQVIIEDDRCAPKDGSNVFNKLVNVDKVTAIIGPVCSAVGGAALPTAQNGGVPTIVFGSAPNLTKIGDYIFRTYPSDSFQGVYAAELLYNTHKKIKAAVVYVKNDYGQGLHEVFSKKFRELGGTIVFEEGIAQDAKDLRTIATKVKAANPDVIYLPVYPANGVVLAKEFKNLGVKAAVVGGDALDTNEVLSVPEANGFMYVLGKFNNPDEFKARIKTATGKESNLVTPLAYDAVNIYAELIRKAGTDRKAIRDAMQTLEKTDAVALPLISFDENGDIKSAQYEVRVVKNGKGEVVQ